MNYQLSVVIPSYNSAKWLPTTIAALSEAASKANHNYEALVLDDGSTDNTSSVLANLTTVPKLHLRIVTKQNQGRFLAVLDAIKQADCGLVMILNSRQLVAPDFFQKYEELHSLGFKDSVCGFVATDDSTNLIGHFWELPVSLFWGHYTKSPSRVTLTAENFDKYPKGTGSFIVHKDFFIEACEKNWPQGDISLSSDDTKILRWIAENGSLTLEPSLKSTYRPRTSFGPFLRHGLDRGTMFVDSYQHKTTFYSILILLALSPIVLVTIILGAFMFGNSEGILTTVTALALFFTGTLILGIMGKVNGVSNKSVLSFWVYIVPFSVVFWLGIIRGLFLHKREKQ